VFGLTYTPAVIRAAIALVSILAAGAALPQSTRPGVVRSRAAYIGYAIRWVDAVLSHRPGELDAAVEEVGGWDAGIVRELPIELQSVRRLMRDPRTRVFLVPSTTTIPRQLIYSDSERESLRDAALSANHAGFRDDDLVLRGVLLHTDIATVGSTAGTVLLFADGRDVGLERHVDHWQTARALANSVDSSASRGPDVGLWYRATLALMEASDRWSVTHAAEAVAHFPDDAKLLFLAGCLHEALEAARVQASLAGTRLPGDTSFHVKSSHDELRLAEALLKRALASEPGFVEARIRYGRVLTLLDRPDDAVKELRRAAGEPGDPVLDYFAQLFLGAAAEAGNRRDDARRAYERAAALAPQAQSPRLSLSQLAARAGDRGAALRALEPILAQPSGIDDRFDPWWSYYTSPGRTADTLMIEARQRLSTLHGAASIDLR
jgi:tetratricopeptide (TPR) repeat protein